MAGFDPRGGSRSKRSPAPGERLAEGSPAAPAADSDGLGLLRAPPRSPTCCALLLSLACRLTPPGRGRRL